MAKKIRFPLDMGNGIEVRTLEDLQENFSIEKVLGYYSDGKLVTWLRDRYLDDIADTISELNKDDSNFTLKICNAFGVEYNEEVDMETLEERNRKMSLLKQYTDKKEYYDVVDDIAFNQDELYDLLDDDKHTIYLCGDKFSIPLAKHGMKYIGVNNPVVLINAKEIIDFTEKNIELDNVKFDDAYQSLINNFKETDSCDTIAHTDLLDDFNNLKGNNLVERIEKEILEETILADQARYMLYQLWKYVPKFKKKITLDSSSEIKKAANNGYEPAKIRCSFDFKLYNDNGEYYRCCLGKDYSVEDDEFVLYEAGVAQLNDSEYYSKAIDCIKKSADLGCWIAEGSMGIRYEYGGAVDQNYVMANQWYRKAAEKGVTKWYYEMYGIYFNEIRDIESAKMCIKEMFDDKDYAIEWVATYKKDIEHIGEKSYGNYGCSSLGYNGIGEIESKSKSYVLRKLEDEWPKFFAKINEVFDTRRNSKFDKFVEEYINEYQKLLERWKILMYGTGKTDHLSDNLNDLSIDYKSDIRTLLSNLLHEYELNFSMADVDEDEDYVWHNFSISGGGLFSSVDYRGRINLKRFLNKLNNRLSEYSIRAHAVMKEYFLNTLL
ncbi:MAG: tetratricopeptide repeat protein [Clostridiales bacterium]|nr:tetratricopeptide repeat protein [Clostridiales bacterium]